MLLQCRIARLLPPDSSTGVKQGEFPPCWLLPVTLMRQLFDVMHQAIQLPLGIDLAPPAQGETIEAFVVPNLAKHRFDGGKALSVAGFAGVAVDGLFHPVAMAWA